MNKDELLSLPASVAIGLIWDASASLQQKLAGVDKPRGPLPPKYDHRLRRKNQRYVWASEATLESLTWELGRARAEASEGGQWADKAAKNATTLERWVNWRTWYPNDRWSGTRGDVEVQAQAPSKHPAMHSWEQKVTPREVRGDAYEDAGEGADDLNF